MSRTHPFGIGPSGLIDAALRLPVADRLLCEIRFIWPLSGQQVVRPVRYARSGNDIIILVRDTDQDGWWRTFAHPHPAQVLLQRHWYQGLGRMVRYGQRQWAIARCAYQDRFASRTVTDTDGFVVIKLRPTDAYELVPEALRSLHVVSA